MGRSSTGQIAARAWAKSWIASSEGGVEGCVEGGGRTGSGWISESVRYASGGPGWKPWVTTGRTGRLAEAPCGGVL